MYPSVPANCPEKKMRGSLRAAIVGSSVDIRISMNLSETQELRVLQAWNHSKYASLVVEFEVVLEAHDVVAGLHQVFLPKLNNRVRRAACARIGEPDRPHRAIPQRVATPAGQLLDRQARFKIVRLFKVMMSDALGVQ